MEATPDTTQRIDDMKKRFPVHSRSQQRPARSARGAGPADRASPLSRISIRFLRNAKKRLQYVFATQNPVLTFASSGTGAMEAAITGVLSPGDTMIHVEAGKFGQRWGDIGKAYGMNVVTIKVEWGNAATPEIVEEALKANPQAKAVYATLCETSTATLTDIEAIGKVVAKSDALFGVDTISGLAADVFKADEWGVDLAVGGSQKALMLPPGPGLPGGQPQSPGAGRDGQVPVLLLLDQEGY